MAYSKEYIRYYDEIVMDDFNDFFSNREEAKKDIIRLKAYIRLLKKYRKPYMIALDILESNNLSVPMYFNKYKNIEDIIELLYRKNDRDIVDFFNWQKEYYEDSRGFKLEHPPISEDELSVMQHAEGGILGLMEAKEVPFEENQADVLTVKKIIEDIGRDYAEDLVEQFKRLKSTCGYDQIYTDKSGINSETPNVAEEVIKRYNAVAEEFYKNPKVWMEKYDMVDNAVSREEHPTRRV